jgi:hypothetical protein
MLTSMIDGMKQQSDLVLAALTHDDDGATAQSIVHYQRFDVPLDAQSLRRLGLSDLAADVDSILPMDRADNLMPLLEIGRRAGQTDLDNRLFDPSFDVRPTPEGLAHVTIPPSITEPS